MRERKACAGVMPLRPVLGFFSPRARSWRTCSTSGACSSRNPTIPCRRGSRWTPWFRFLAAHLRDNKVVEYDANFKETWSYEAFHPWWATRLKNGNTLITEGDHTDHHPLVQEVNRQGEVVWQFSQQDAPEYQFFIFQEAGRLANGDTVICNWCPHDLNPKFWPGTVQVLEVSPEKKVVWALSAWTNPDQ